MRFSAATVLTGALCVLLQAFTALAGNGPVNNRIYAELLQKNVSAGMVDYRGFKEDELRLDAYLGVLERVDSNALTRNEQFAFYINAYNAWTIKLILTAWPRVSSIRDLGGLLSSPWKKKWCRIDGAVLTLHDIEHGILRKRFNDPRVHVALNCASKGCPPLRSEPYAGAHLDRQLDEAARGFVNDAGRNRLEGDTLYVSRIFKWFADDFNDDIIGFFKQHARDRLRQELERRSGALKIKYLPYDWSLNRLD